MESSLTSSSTSSTTVDTGSSSGSSSSALYAIAVPMLVWLVAVFCCYPILFLFYRYCMRVRFGKSPDDLNTTHHNICCCYIISPRSDDTHSGETEDNDSSQATGGEGHSSSRRRRRPTVGAPHAAPPPAYEIALGMRKPSIGDVVRFQNTTDGGWCTFTFTTHDDDALCDPPAYAFDDVDDQEGVEEQRAAGQRRGDRQADVVVELDTEDAAGLATVVTSSAADVDSDPDDVDQVVVL